MEFLIGAVDELQDLGRHAQQNPRALTAKSAPLIVASGTLTFRACRNRLRGTWQDGEACHARSDADTRRTPQLAGRAQTVSIGCKSPLFGGNFALVMPCFLYMRAPLKAHMDNETRKAMQPQHERFASMGRHLVTTSGNYAAAGPKLRRRISGVFRYQTCGAETQK